MTSPFPGMDPYIEARGLWGDFHTRLVAKIVDALSRAVPDRYVVRSGERSYLVIVEPDEKKTHAFVPDASVATPRGGRKKPGARKGGAAVAEADSAAAPVTLRAFITEQHREHFVEVYEADGERRLVTAVEVLSPSNKRPNSQGRNDYLRKRQSLMLDLVNLVEIDLLRGGERMPMLDPWPDSPYTLTVAPADIDHRCRVWPAHFRRPLPVISIPLADPDPDVPLDLQPLVADIYRWSSYARDIDYAKPLEPALAADDAAWLADLMRAR